MAKRLGLRKFHSPCENPTKFAAKFRNAIFATKILALRNPCKISHGLLNFATVAKFPAIFLLSSGPLCLGILAQPCKHKHRKIHKNNMKMKNKLQLILS